MRWSVYRYSARVGLRKLTPLGYVNAPDKIAAIAHAARRFTVDPRLPDFGFYPIAYRDDRGPIGQAATRRDKENKREKVAR